MGELNFIRTVLGRLVEESFPLLPINLPDHPTVGAAIVWECQNYEGNVLVRVTQTYDNHIADDQIQELTTIRCTNIRDVRQIIEDYLDDAWN